MWQLLTTITLLTAAAALPALSREDDVPLPALGQTWVEIGGQTYGAKPDATGPIGGGPGYTKIVTDGRYKVKTPEELVAALAKAQAGEVVFLEPQAELDFTCDFDVFRYCVRDDWQQVQGEKLVEACRGGCALKIGVSGLCDDLALEGEVPLPHEVFVQIGSAYYCTEQRLLAVGSHPVVRVRPGLPMRYATDNWDFGWLFARTDGHVVYRRCDPYSLRFDDRTFRCPVRWFAR